MVWFGFLGGQQGGTTPTEGLPTWEALPAFAMAKLPQLEFFEVPSKLYTVLHTVLPFQEEPRHGNRHDQPCHWGRRPNL